MASKQPSVPSSTDDVIVVDPEIPSVLVVDTSSSEDDSDDESDVEQVALGPSASEKEIPKAPIVIDETINVDVEPTVIASSSSANTSARSTLVPAPEVNEVVANVVVVS